MYLDALLLVSDAQAFAATGFSTNTIDLGNTTVKRQIGTGEAIGFGVTVDVAADAASGDETYTFEVVESANADLSAPTVIHSQAIARALLTAGSKWFFDIPPGYPKARYVGLRLTLGGTTPSITITASLMPRELFSVEPVAYPKGYNV